MDLPSTREIELETLLREREAQLTQLTDEVSHLRQYISNQPGPSTTDHITLPPPLISLLLPHINAARSGTSHLGAGASSSGSAPSSVTTAVLQRAKVLQAENDELYDLLKHGEVGKLKEEVRGLRRVVQKLEGALKESHQVVSSLSTELEKSYTTVLSSAPPPTGPSRSPTISNRASNAQWPSRNVGNGVHVSPDPTTKPPPTGPRAQKKPRLSVQERDLPPHTSVARSSGEPVTGAGRRSGAARERERERTRDRKRSRSRSPRVRAGKDARVDGADGRHTRARSRSRSLGRDSENHHERDRERGRDKDRPSRRRGGGRGKHADPPADDLDDRTLATRMGV